MATRLVALVWYCARLVAICSRNPPSACFVPDQPRRVCFSTQKAGASGSGDEKRGCLRVDRHYAHQAGGGERASHRPVVALPGVLLPDVHGHGSGGRFPGNIRWVVTYGAMRGGV